MNDMDWDSWFKGLITAFSSGAIIAIGSLMALKEPPDWWRLMLIAILPMALQFFSYLKQCPPSIHKHDSNKEGGKKKKKKKTR